MEERKVQEEDIVHHNLTVRLVVEVVVRQVTHEHLLNKRGIQICIIMIITASKSLIGKE